MRALTFAIAVCAAVSVSVAPARAETVVSLTFDDGQATQYPAVKDLLAARGAHATFFVNSAKVGTSDFYMSWAQVDALAAAGHEIAGHTLTHVGLNGTDLSEAEKRRQVCEDRQNLIARGYDPVTFAYPNGWGDALAESIVRDCGYRAARRVGGIVSPNWCPNCGSPRAESLPPEDPFLVRTPAFGSGEITLAAMQNVITQAEFTGGWVPLVFHGVCESGACGDGWVRPSTLAALLDWLATRTSQGTVVKTMRAALEPPPPPVGVETTIDSKPPATTIDKGATFALSSNATGATFECSLDGAAFSSCATPVSYSSLGVGQHTFRARARDVSGVLDATPASWTWTINAPPAPTTVSLTFDDGQATQYSVRQALKDHGMKGTFYVNSNSVCTSDCAGAFDMTWQQINDLAADGNEIGGHTLDHVDLTSTSMSAAEKRRQVCEDRQNLVARGFDPVSFAYPYARENAEARAIVAECGYSSARSAGDAPAGGETIPPLNPFATRTADYSADEITLAEMQGVVTQAENVGGGWVQLAFHGFCATRCNDGWVKPSTFVALLDWLQQRQSATGTVVRTVRQVVEGGAPETSLVSKPPALAASRAAAFTLSSNRSGATYECSLDGAPFSPCTSTPSFSNLTDGSHTFLARARDAAGVVDPSPETWTWTVDVTAPDTTIASGPSGTVASRSASFAFGSSESGAFQCSLDAGEWASCASPKSYSSLANGPHTFAVRALDAAGNVDGSPASRTWTVEVNTSEPEPRTIVSLTFDDGQATQYPAVKDILASRGVNGTFFVNSAKVGTSDFYVTWPEVAALAADGNEIGGHTLTHVDLTSALSEAEKRRQVCEDRQNLIARGYDPVSFAYPGGATDLLAESIVRDCGYTAARLVGGIVSPNWCPNCGSPRAELLPPEDPFAVRTPAFGSGEITLSAIQGVVTQAELAGGWVPLVFHGVCETATCGTGWVRPTTLAALLDWLATRSAQGTVVRTMREALDPSTPPPPPPAAPDTSIASGPTGTVASTAASFEFSSDKASASFECKLDAGAWEACASPKAYSGLADGSHTFSVRATDGGAVDATPATRTWTVDAAAPDTSITSGASGTVASGSASFAFTATKAGSSFECKLDAGAWEACTSPKTYSGLADGSHTFSVRAKDASGNVDPSPATRTWAVDTTAADTSIVSGPTGAVRSTSASFGFTATQAGSFECKLDAGAWAACTSPTAYSGLTQGPHTFSVRAKDALGNVDATPATRSWTVDTVAPNTSITSGPSGSIYVSTATFGFTASEAGATFECRLDGGSWSVCTSPKTYTVSRGSHTFYVRAKDVAGNVDSSPASRSFRRRR